MCCSETQCSLPNVSAVSTSWGIEQASNSDVKAKLRRPPRGIQGKADKRSYSKRLLFQTMSFKSLLESCGFFKSKGLFCFLTVFSFRGTGSHASKAHGYTPPSQERHLQRTTELGAFTGFIKHRDKWRIRSKPSRLFNHVMMLNRNGRYLWKATVFWGRQQLCPVLITHIQGNHAKQEARTSSWKM